MHSLWQDLRLTFRQLKKSPGFAVTAVLTLALGIGATTAMLAIVDSVLLRPLSFPHSERLMGIDVGDRDRQGSGENVGGGMDYKAYQEFKQSAHSLESLSIYTTLPTPLKIDGVSEVHMVGSVSPDIFSTLEVQPRLGRDFKAEDLGQDVAIVTELFWKKYMQPNSSPLGRIVRMGERDLTVVGVLPAGFQFPLQVEDALYTPLHLDREMKDERGFDSFSAIGKLRAGVSKEVARQEGESIVQRLPHDAKQPAPHFWILPYQAAKTGDQKPALLALLAGCALLFTIACVNATSLQLARFTRRTEEIALRASMGATRGRILRQMFTETSVVAALAGALGLIFANFALQYVRLTYGDHFARFDELGIHAKAFLGCFVIVLLSGAASSLLPAMRLLRSSPSQSLYQKGASSRVSHRSLLSGALVSMEIGLTCLLLIAGGLFLRTFQALQHVPLGFNPEHATSMVLMPETQNRPLQELSNSYDRLLETMNHLPGVDAAGFVTTLPFSQFQMTIAEEFSFLGTEQSKHPSTQLSAVSADYFRAMQIPLLAGRGIQEGDHLGMPLAVVANQAFVRKFLQGGAAIGKQLQFDKDSGFSQPMTIVGVVGDSMQGRDLTGTTEPMLFMSYQQVVASRELANFILGIAPSFVIRSSLAQDALNNQLKNALKTSASGLSIMELNPTSKDLQGSLQSRKLALRLAMSFGFVALLLAAIGIYGSQAYVVAQSTKEIGIRMALGSTRKAAAMVIFRHAMFLSGWGLGFGVVVALLSGRWIKSLLFGVPPQDPLTVALVVLLIAGASILATLVPAYRAASTDPMQALRSE